MSWLTYLQIAESSAYCRPAYLRDPHDLVFWMADSSCHSMPQIQWPGISNRDWWGKLSHLASCKSFCLDTTSMWPNFYIFLQAGVMDFSSFFRRFAAWKPLHGSESISRFGSKTELESTFASGSPKPSSLVDCFDCATAAGRLCCRHCSQRPGQTRDFQVDPKPFTRAEGPKLFLWRIKQRRKIKYSNWQVSWDQ